MKRIIAALFLTTGMLTTVHAAVRGDVKVLEAAGVIKYRINDLAKNYLLYVQFPYKQELKGVLKSDLEALNQSFKEIALTTKDPKTKGMLTFFAYQKTRIEEIVLSHTQPKDTQIAKEILDISDSYDEGADAIARHHQYPFTDAEKMFHLTRTMAQHLQIIVKYYLAYRIDQKDPQILKKLHTMIDRFTAELSQAQAFPYPDPDVRRTRERLTNTWQVLLPYLTSARPQQEVPMFVSAAATHLNDLLTDLSIYHSKNQ